MFFSGSSAGRRSPGGSSIGSLLKDLLDDVLVEDILGKLHLFNPLEIFSFGTIDRFSMCLVFSCAGFGFLPLLMSSSPTRSVLPSNGQAAALRV